jgi:DNA polymerase-3 subunit gamma/tau
VARSAEGSMRDALSLLDQVIAFGGGKLTAEDTRTMLGSLDRTQVFGIVEALSARDARKVLEQVNELDEHAPDYREVLAELAGLLQKLALLQAVPDMQLDEAEDVERYKKLATAISPEDTHLFYQIAVVGRRDLELAPDARGGFEMVLLRMLAFGLSEATQAPSAAPTPIRAGVSSAAPAVARAAPPSAPAGAVSAANSPTMAATAAPQAPQATPQPAASAGESDWATMVTQMSLAGIVRQLAAHCTLLGRQGNVVKLALDPEGEHYRTAMMEDKLVQALTTYYGQPMRVDFTVSSAATVNTPAKQMKQAAEDRVQNARAAIETDPNVRAMREVFGATVTPDSIRPNDN